MARSAAECLSAGTRLASGEGSCDPQRQEKEHDDILIFRDDCMRRRPRRASSASPSAAPSSSTRPSSIRQAAGSRRRGTHRARGRLLDRHCDSRLGRPRKDDRGPCAGAGAAMPEAGETVVARVVGLALAADADAHGAPPALGRPALSGDRRRHRRWRGTARFRHSRRDRARRGAGEAGCACWRSDDLGHGPLGSRTPSSTPIRASSRRCRSSPPAERPGAAGGDRGDRPATLRRDPRPPHGRDRQGSRSRRSRRRAPEPSNQGQVA